MQPRFHIWDCMGPQSLTFCWSVWCNYPNNQYNYYALLWDGRVDIWRNHWHCHHKMWHKDYLSLTRNAYLWVTRNWNDVFVCLGGLQVTETDVECHWLCPHPTSSSLPCSALLTPAARYWIFVNFGQATRYVAFVESLKYTQNACFVLNASRSAFEILDWELLVGNFEERCILLMPSSVPPVSRLCDARAWDIDLFALGEHELSQRSQEIVRKCVK